MNLKPVSKIIHINRNTDPGSETNLSGIPNEHTGHHIRGFTTKLHKGYNTPQDSRQDSGISCWSQIHKVQRQPIQQDHKPLPSMLKAFDHMKIPSTSWGYDTDNVTSPVTHDLTRTNNHGLPWLDHQRASRPVTIGYTARTLIQR